MCRRLGRWMESYTKTSMGKTLWAVIFLAHWMSMCSLLLVLMEGPQPALVWEGLRVPAGLCQWWGWSLAALWAELLCVAGPENQSQQSPGREEVSAAWQPEEASGDWENSWTSQKDFQVLIKSVGPPRTLRTKLKKLLEMKFLSKCRPWVLWD